MMNEELIILGQQLRAIRLERDFALDDVARATKIRRHILESIENGEFDASLTEMQLRGFLRNYATFLRLDLDAMLDAYREMQANTQNRRFGLFKPKPADEPASIPVVPLKQSAPLSTPPLPISRVTSSTIHQTQEISTVSSGRFSSILRNGLLFVMVVILAGILAIAGFAALDEINNQTSDDRITPQDSMIESQPSATFAPDDNPKFIESSPTPLPTPTLRQADGIVVSTPNQPDMTGADSISIGIEANQRSWLRLMVDGQVEYESILRPGTGLQFRAQRTITLRTSNAAGLDVVINNQPLGVLGGRGELYEQTFTLGEPSAPGLAPQVTTPQGQTTPPPASENLPTPLPTAPIIATEIPSETPVSQ